MPTAVDVIFKGPFGEQREALHNLPIYINKPRLYHLLPKVSPQQQKVSSLICVYMCVYVCICL